MSASRRVEQRLVPLVLAGLLAASSVHVSCAGCARRSLQQPQVAATVFPLYDITRRWLNLKKKEKTLDVG